jgi:hypothetical protein
MEIASNLFHEASLFAVEISDPFSVTHGICTRTFKVFKSQESLRFIQSALDQRYGNAALQKSANLSSVWKDGTNASFAVDGHVAYDYKLCATSGGYNESNPYLIIDLSHNFSIDHVTVFTRLDEFSKYFKSKNKIFPISRL